MGPINYATDVQSPFQAALQGYQAGSAIRQDQQQQAAQAQALKQQQELRAAQMQAFQNPTADNFSRLMAMDPKSSEAYQRAWSTRNTQQQQSLASDLLQWGAAIKSGKPEIAAQALTARADAMEKQNGAPTPDSQALRVQARMAAEHPEFALGQIQALLASNPNGKDASETLAKFGAEQRAQDQAPGALKKINADADAAVSEAATKAITAKYGEKSVLLELQKKGVEIQHLIDDTAIKKEGNRIASMNAAAAREGNALKREELKLQIAKTRQDLDDKVRAKVADANAARASIDQLLDTADQILLTPDDTQRAALGALDSRTPTLLDSTADFERLVETMGSQVFLASVEKMKGLGALTEAEGKRLEGSLKSFDLKQSPERFRANVKEIQRLMLKARKDVETKYGVASTVPDTPSAAGASDIDALVKKYSR